MGDWRTVAQAGAGSRGGCRLSQHLGHQVHAADGALAGRVAHDLGVHGAGVQLAAAVATGWAGACLGAVGLAVAAGQQQ